MRAPVRKKISLQHTYEKRRKDIFNKIIANTNPKSEIDIIEPFIRSTYTLGDYVTLDYKHKMDITQMKRRIKAYALDKTRKRPLNFLMIAAPGSGKSHFIKCLARSMDHNNIHAVNFNMANKSNIDDLTQPLEAVRNLKVTDYTPILFLDEFDSSTSNYSQLLPLLWDGELHIGHRDLKLGKVIIILAGSDPRIKEMIKKAKNMQKEAEFDRLQDDEKKIIDLLSRVNGGLFEIPGLEEKSDERDRRVDKVCIALSLLGYRFGSDLQLVPWNILNFIGNNRFQYDVRSIEHLIDTIPFEAYNSDKKRLEPQKLKLPLNSIKELKESNLAYHLIAESDPDDIIERWEKVSDVDTLVRFKEQSEEEED